MGLAETAELAVRISLKDNASAGIRGLQRNLGGLSGSVARVGKGVGQIGTGLARAGLLIGGAAITGMAAVAREAVKFEDAFAGVRKTVNESDLTAVGLSFDKLATSFRTMATNIPIAATEFAKIGETAGALGIQAKDLEAFTKTVALLGETTNLSTDEAAEALGKVGTILHLTGRDFEDFADILVNLGNQGASTESEIIEVAKRFAAVGRQAGLSKDQILALSSAATSLGAEPEAAGSALSRIFANMTTEIANGTDKGKEFAKVTGDSLKELRQRLNKGDALGILKETLEGLSGLSRTEAASVLKALGITNVRDRDAILKMAQNLEFVNDQLAIAKNSEGALWKEAEKRFATTASKIQLVKNNLIETGIAMGNEMLPAIGRALDKVIGVLKDPATKASAIQLGKDIGKFIDDIDWAKVKDGALALKDAMKGAVDFSLALLRAFDKLPGEIKGATVGFLALNKLSGGLLATGVGNVVGGLAGGLTSGLASRAPGIGKLFAQPVFVTNWPAGGLGGGVGGAGGAGLGLVGTVAATAGVGGAVATAGNDLGVIAAAVGKGYQAYEQKDQQGIAQSMRDMVAGVWSLPGPIRDAMVGQMDRLIPQLPTAASTPVRILTDHQDALRTAAMGGFASIRDKAEANRIATVTSKNAIVSSGHSDRNAIVTAIARNRPIVNVGVKVNTTNTTLVRITKNYQTSSQIGRQSGFNKYDH